MAEENWEVSTEDSGLSERVEYFLEKILSEKKSRVLGAPVEEHPRVFIMITRRGYWLYRVAKEKGNLSVPESLEIYSDRYLTRVLAPGFLKDKEVVLFDDTLTDGKRMFEFYALLKHLNEDSRPHCVIPVVYNMSMTYEMEGESKEKKRKIYYKVCRLAGKTKDGLDRKFENELKEFHKNLRFEKRVDPTMFAGFSIEQTDLFQKHLAPLVMNLPMLRKEKQSAREEEREIVLTGEQFERITDGNREWLYTDISYKDLTTPDLYFGFFELLDEELLDTAKNMLHDMTVKLKYNRLSDGKVQVIFTPFAILKSMTMVDVHRVFCKLFQGTSYYKHVEGAFWEQLNKLKPEEQGTPMNEVPDTSVYAVLREDYTLCCAEYRSIIFNISDYVSAKFKKYVKEVTGLILLDDMEIMEENFEKSFIETVTEFHEESEADPDGFAYRYREDLLKLSQVTCVGKNSFESRGGETPEGEPIVPSEEDVYMLLHSVIDRHKQQRDGCEYNISFEELEFSMRKNFRFHAEKNMRNCLSYWILKLLEISVVGNDVSIIPENGVICHDFRPGENADIYCRRDILYLYAYFYGAFAGRPDEQVLKHIEYMLLRIEILFNQKNYYDFLISRKEFVYYKHYFLNHKKDGDLKKCVQNKDYLLDEYFREDTDRRDPYIQEAMRNAVAWIAE